jgi:hypothetical protein
MIPGLLAATLCFVLFLAIIIVWFHIAPGVHRFGTMARVWLSLLVLYVPLYFWLQHLLPASLAAVAPLTSLEGAVNFANGLVVFTLMYLNFCALYTSDHGLSLAFMFELEGRADKQMTLDELIQRFPYDAMLRGRLRDLEANNFGIREGEYFRLTSKGRLVVMFLGGIKRLLKLEPGG